MSERWIVGVVQPIPTHGLLVQTLDDLIALLSTPGFASYPLREREEGTVEVGCGAGSVLCAPAIRWRTREALTALLARARMRNALLLLLGEEEDFERASDLLDVEGTKGDVALASWPIGATRLRSDLAHFERLFVDRADAKLDERAIERYAYELQELNAIARAITAERDIERLLGLVLEKSRYVTGADAGSVYVVEPDEPASGEGDAGERRRLRFRVTQNESLPVNLKEFTLPIDERSIVGQAVLRKRPISIPDLYELVDPARNPWGYRHDRSIDAKTGYETRSLLTVPMIDAAGEVLGVIQLINRKREPRARLHGPEDFARLVIPFDERTEELAASLASQAGIALENATLYGEIRQLFEGFVHASVTAIESRDPTTSGHSQRVARLTVDLAQKVAAGGDGPYAAVSFTRDTLRQIEYAALLHDFGKVGVRENVLVKAKKLYDGERDVLLARFDLLRERAMAEAARHEVEILMGGGAGDPTVAARLAEIEGQLGKELARLDADLQLILKANEPTVLEQGGFERLYDIASRRYRDRAGVERPVLTPAEVTALSIPRGSLTHDERHEIESHVVHTFNFLRRIPWGRSLREIPRIAVAHHEKLDGSGYPRRLRGDEIPLPARMMTIADIFDALTASDRPYKRAVPCDKALDILASDVQHGKVDAELFRIFVDAKVYQSVL